MTQEATQTAPVTSPSGSTDGMAVEELLAKAQDAAVVQPSDKDSHILQRETDEQPGMQASRVSGAGYKWLWDTKTFERFAILSYMFGQKLKEKREDGSLRFTSVKPAGVQIGGTLLCWLHADSPMRDHYNTIGLRVCRKHNLTNQYQVEQHCKKKHPQEYAIIKSEQAETERQEGLTAQRAQTSALLALAGKSVEAAPDVAPAASGETFQCPHCDRSPYTTEDSLNRHMTSKHKE